MSTASRKIDEKSKAPLQDSNLVRQCLKGKESAWAALIDKYKYLIYSIPVRNGFSQEDSADIFQAVCMDLLQELENLREPKALAGWLIQVTRNKCFHYGRKRDRSQTEDVAEQEISTEQDPTDNVLIQVQQEQMIREALAELSPRCRRLVNLLFFETPARPYDQVAKDLNLAPGSIGFIRRRCLDKLRQHLERMGF